MDKARVCFLVPYTGRWPRWCKLFFDSVGRNPVIDVIVACTTVPPCTLPPNVRLYELTSGELSSRFGKATGLNVGIISGHKLCDFRPFFGLAFADLLAGYEFWGFCDIDLVLGDLSKFLTSDFLNPMDVFSAHDQQIVGHFTIIRNCERLNRLAFEMKGWQQACLLPSTAMVEEKNFSGALDEAPDVRWIKPNSLFEELASGCCRQGITFGFRGEIAYLAGSRPALVEERDGRMIYIDEARKAEVLYVHFMGLKHWWHWIAYRAIDSHPRFSRVGYGGPTRVDSLTRFPWRQLWVSQIWLVKGKSWFGGVLRQILPQGAFLSVRRIILGRSRY